MSQAPQRKRWRLPLVIGRASVPSAEMRSPRRKRWRLLLVIGLSALALAGGAGFSQRGALLTWYYAHELKRAPDGEQQQWLAKLVDAGEPAVPRLLALLQQDDAGLCDTARSGLEQLLRAWGPKDEKSGRLADRFFELHPSFSPTGQVAALQLLPEVLATGVEAEAKARTIVSAALKDRSAEQRCLGITVAMRPELNLLPSVVPLLDDPDARVRRKAMLILGPEPADGAEKPLVETDDLLRWLHDPDPEVRQMCETFLIKSRGRSERDVRFGRLLTHPDPMKRLQLLLALPEEEDINVGVWLQRLSKDPESAVRAGAVRVAVEHRIDFADRVDQMMHNDPDGTVRKIAEHYRKFYR
jgi:hypothetical protein